LKLGQLKVVVVEDEVGSRHILKNLFRHAGVRQVEALANGQALLKQYEVVDVDLLILGYDLGDQLRGPDLLRHLIRQQRLTPWTQVAFITNQVQAVEAELPVRLLPTRIIAKPISLKLLIQQIRETLLLREHVKPLLQALAEQPCLARLRQLLRLQAGHMPKASRDTIRIVQTRILLDWGYAQEAWQLSARVKSELMAIELRLELAYLLGKTNTVQQLLQQMEEKQWLRRQLDLYRWRMQADAEQEAVPQQLFFVQKESELTPHEMNLSAILRFQYQGYQVAVDYIQDKICRAKGDHYQQNALLITWISLCLLQALSPATTQPDQVALDREQLAGIARELANKLAWQHGAVDFKRFTTLVDLAIVVTTEPHQPDWAAELQQMLDNSDQLDSFQCIWLAYIFLQLGLRTEANSLLWQGDRRLMQMPMAPERLTVGFFHRQLFRHVNPQADQAAAAYLHWGSLYQQLKLWYRALKMAYLSLQWQPSVTAAFLLTELMVQLKLSSYRELDLGQLYQQLATFELTPTQKLWLHRLQQPQQATQHILPT
jgi:CheY-like chemotaxis protein